MVLRVAPGQYPLVSVDECEVNMDPGTCKACTSVWSLIYLLSFSLFFWKAGEEFGAHTHQCAGLLLALALKYHSWQCSENPIWYRYKTKVSMCQTSVLISFQPHFPILLRKFDKVLLSVYSFISLFLSHFLSFWCKERRCWELLTHQTAAFVSGLHSVYILVQWSASCGSQVTCGSLHF